MAFNEPRTMPPRLRPSNVPNGTHQFPANQPRPTTQTTLEKSALRFDCYPHQISTTTTFVEEEAFGEEKDLGEEKALCLCKLVEEERCEKRRTRENQTTQFIFLKCFPN